MAPVLAILKATGRAILRDLGTFQSVTGSNFFFFMLLVAYQQPGSALFFAVLLGIMMFVPLSSDPLQKIPSDRLALWPLDPRQWTVLRAASLLLSPILWIAAGIVVWRRDVMGALEFVAFAAAIRVASYAFTRVVGGAPSASVFRWVPPFPGRLGQLIRKDLRQILSTLDPYVALLLAIGAVWYRFTPNADPAAPRVISLLIALVLSTYAQCLFGLDGLAGITRYRMLPMRGWQILLAKDIAFLVVLIPLVVWLRPIAGIGGGIIALAAGHHVSVYRPMSQHRWRFTSGVLIPTGLIQGFGIFALGNVIDDDPIRWCALPVAALVISLWFYGRAWDKYLKSDENVG